MVDVEFPDDDVRFLCDIELIQNLANPAYLTCKFIFIFVFSLLLEI